MELFRALCFLIALVLLIVGSFGTWEKPKVNLIALGLAFFVAPFVVEAFQGV